MIVLDSLENLPRFNAPIITIGAFDGLHLGHQALIRKLHEISEESGGDKIVMSFSPHPRKVLYPEEDFKILTTVEEKIERLSALGMDYLILIPFTKEFAEYSPEFFFEDILIHKVGAKKIVVGHDHSFGKNRNGDLKLLQNLSQQYAIEIIETPEVFIDAVPVRSSVIRKMIAAGNLAMAERFLGHKFPKPY